MISVIVPVFNAAPYLAELFSSLEKQTELAEQIIFINDDSTDNSEELILSYIEVSKNKIVYKKKENGGSASARNLGLALASSEFVIFLDSDDILELNRIEEDSKALNSNIDLLFGPVEIFDELENSKFAKSKHEKNLIELAKGSYLKSVLERKLYIPPCAATVRTKLAKEINGFDESLQYCEDFDFWLRYIKKNTAVNYVNRVVAKYRFGHLSKSANIEIKHQYRMKILDKYFLNSRSKAKNTALVYANLTLSTANDYYRQLDYKNFRKYYKEAKVYSDSSISAKERKRYFFSFFKELF